MKILYVITKSNFGGAQRYVYELATAMKAEGHDVAVAFGGSGILKDKLEAAGVKTREVKSFQRDISLLKEFRSFVELWRLYKAEKPDVVHLNSSKAGGSGALIARFTGVKKIIYTAHGWAFWEPRPLLWRVLVWGASWVTALLCHKVIMVSDFEKERTNLPFTKRKFRVVHTAVPKIDFVDREFAREKLFSRDEIERHQNDIWLVTNAELNHNKNLFYAIDAVAEYNKSANSKIFYSIISDGELFDKLTDYIKEKGLQQNVKLHGYVDDARVYLKAFDIFLLPSKKEGMPYAVLEAGAAGLPVIASNVGGIPEIIDNNENGLLIDPNNVSTLVEALQKLADSADIRTDYGSKLKQKVESEFALEKMVRETARLY